MRRMRQIQYNRVTPSGNDLMVKDKIRDAFIDKVAEATGINPDLVRFATGRFEQAKLAKKMNNQAAGLGRGVGAVMGAVARQNTVHNVIWRRSITFKKSNV